LKVTQPYPFTFPDSHKRPVILESYQYPSDGEIAEDKIPGKAEKGDYIDRSVYLKISCQPVDKKIVFAWYGFIVPPGKTMGAWGFLRQVQLILPFTGDTFNIRLCFMSRDGANLTVI
jgi:hypothetical protein